MAIGFLAMLPLFLAYELAVAREPGLRNSAEVVLSLPLIPFAPHADAARRCILAACAACAMFACFHGELGLLPRTWRVELEGALCAVLMGPLLIVLLRLAGVHDAAGALRSGAPADVPRAVDAARLVGGAAYEEIVFRVGIQSALFVAFRHLFEFLMTAEHAARTSADVLSVCCAAALFSAAHLSVFVAPLGSGGETFDAVIFTWRLFSGIILSALFRWRGPGVAAWAHALFNLALFLGAGPDCFL
jgi:membrane protease YdiL (CAAX protease family)